MSTLPDLLFAMLLVGASWTLAGLSLCGIGLLVQRPSESAPLGIGALLRAFWLGLAAVIAVLQIAHLFVPIGAWATAALSALGTIGIALNGRALLALARRGVANHPGRCGLALLIVLWLTNRAIGPGNAHDSGLYHYSAILWIQSYAIVPGLGNLSPPLALGNASFLFSAMLDSGPWRFRGEHLPNGLLLAAVFIQVIVYAGRLFDRSPRHDPAPALFHLLLIPLLVLLGISKEISSPKTDLPAAMLVFVMCAATLELLRNRARAHGADPSLVFFVIVMAATAWCQKLSTAVVAGGVVGLLAWQLATDLRGDNPALRRAVSVGLLAAALLVVPWCTRNLVTSGYPLFPSTWPAAPVEWQIPQAAVDVQNDFTRDHARRGLPEFVGNVFERAGLDVLAHWMARPEAEEEDRAWMGRWLLSLPITSAVEVLMPLALTLGFGGLSLRDRKRPGRAAMGPAVWMVIPLLAGLFFWFLTAPLPRFAYPVTWSLCAVAGGLALSSRWPAPSRRVAAAATVAVVLLCLPVLAYRATVLTIKDHVSNPLVMIPFLGPGPDHGFHPRPGPLLTSSRTNSGLEVATPKRGWDVRCWTTLVCKGWPEVDAGLRARSRYDLARGFVTDPTPNRSE